MGILGDSSLIVTSKFVKRDRDYDIRCDCVQDFDSIEGNRDVRNTRLSTFYIRDKQNGMFGVVDTRDNVVEYYTSEELIYTLKNTRSLVIQGVLINKKKDIYEFYTLNDIYLKSKEIAEKIRDSESPDLWHLIQHWNAFCHRINYYDPFSYKIRSKYVNRKECRLIGAFCRCNDYDKFRGNKILPYFVETAFRLFYRSNVDVLDLGYFDLSNVVSPKDVFEDCKSKVIAYNDYIQSISPRYSTNEIEAIMGKEYYSIKDLFILMEYDCIVNRKKNFTTPKVYKNFKVGSIEEVGVNTKHTTTYYSQIIDAVTKKRIRFKGDHLYIKGISGDMMIFEVDFGDGTCEHSKSLKDIEDKFNSMESNTESFVFVAEY